MRGIAARENIWNEGIGCFAAKRGIGLDERALGMEAKMIFGENTCHGQSEVPLPPIVGNGMEVVNNDE